MSWTGRGDHQLHQQSKFYLTSPKKTRCFVSSVSQAHKSWANNLLWLTSCFQHDKTTGVLCQSQSPMPRTLIHQRIVTSIRPTSWLTHGFGPSLNDSFATRPVQGSVKIYQNMSKSSLEHAAINKIQSNRSKVRKEITKFDISRYDIAANFCP